MFIYVLPSAELIKLLPRNVYYCLFISISCCSSCSIFPFRNEISVLYLFCLYNFSSWGYPLSLPLNYVYFWGCINELYLNCTLLFGDCAIGRKSISFRLWKSVELLLTLDCNICLAAFYPMLIDDWLNNKLLLFW